MKPTGDTRTQKTGSSEEEDRVGLNCSDSTVIDLWQRSSFITHSTHRYVSPGNYCVTVCCQDFYWPVDKFKDLQINYSKKKKNMSVESYKSNLEPLCTYLLNKNRKENVNSR